MNRTVSVALSAGVAFLACSPASAAQPVFGAVGDGYTDEYFDQGYSYAYNWVSHLVLSRQVDFGPLAVQAAQPNGTWGEPRRTGYKHNWARSSATTQSILQQGQHTGLASQGISEGVTHAIVFVGAENFHYAPFGPYYSIYNGLWTPQQIQNHIDSTVAQTVEAITTLQQAGIKVVVVNIPDYGFAPDVTATFTDPAKRQLVSNVIADANLELQLAASDHQVMYVNLGAALEALFGSHTLPNQMIQIGGRDIDLTATDTSTNSRPWAGFVHGGSLPHTTLQGIVANLIITALNMGHNAGILPLSEEEILNRAGMTYGGQDTLRFHIGSYDDYIYNFACYANCDRSTSPPILTVDDFTCFINLFAQNDPAANCDGSTAEPILTVDDFTCFINKFAQGCF